MEQCFWVGVAFDRDDPTSDDHPDHVAIGVVIRDWVTEHGEPTIELLGRASAQRYASPNEPTIIDIFRAPDGKRIGFGVEVATVEEGRGLIADVAQWLRGFGVIEFVTVYCWTPDDPTRHLFRASQFGTDTQKLTSFEVS